ncbi:MAG TPA: ATP synthase F1 subunit gamma [Thermoanaerobaculia bacterium]|jgi:F-type H+-transporting ATPase subunit gamma|nr:ATP synthase F1 subunit gamma [Thermoanaerobaculia bacterium]
MANRRVLVKRRKAVRNIRKITRTMQLIATARFQAAFNRAVATRPYTEKLAELVADLSRAAGDVDHPLLKTHDEVKRTAVLVLTSDRGLAGGYNASVLRTAVTLLDQQAEQGLASDVHMVGKKGIGFFRFLRRPITEQTSGIGDKPRFEQVEPIANALIDRFTRGEIASVHVVYMKFLSAGQQRPVAVQLLPLKPEEAEGKEAAKPVEYEFSPDPRQLLDELLPATVRVRLFQAFNDAAVSEQVARMVAMKAATDAAADMIKALTREYNRARQTQITMELLDIVGGANALS